MLTEKAQSVQEDAITRLRTPPDVGFHDFRDLRFQSTTSIEDGFGNECAHFLNEVGSHLRHHR